MAVWLPLAALPAAEVAFVVAFAALLGSWLSSPVGRRTLWQVTILTVLALAASEASGAAIHQRYRGVPGRKSTLENKLESIILDEVSFDDLPLAIAPSEPIDVASVAVPGPGLGGGGVGDGGMGGFGSGSIGTTTGPVAAEAASEAKPEKKP